MEDCMKIIPPEVLKRVVRENMPLLNWATLCSKVEMPIARYWKFEFSAVIFLLPEHTDQDLYDSAEIFAAKLSEEFPYLVIHLREVWIVLCVVTPIIKLSA